MLTANMSFNNPARWLLSIIFLLGICISNNAFNYSVHAKEMASQADKDHQFSLEREDFEVASIKKYREQQHIAIIGAGAAGASAAWHLNKLAESQGLNISISIFEKDSRVGGRARTVNAWSQPLMPIELGASLFVEVNQILVGAMEELKLHPRPNQDHDDSLLLGIWDGEQFVFTQSDSDWGWWSNTKILWKYGWAPVRTQKLMKKVVGQFHKMYSAPFFPFRSLTARVHDLGLGDITAVTGSEYLAANKISGPFIDHIIQASTRVNYGSNIGTIHGVEAMVCMAIEGTKQIDGGNWLIFHRMIQSSRASLHLNTSIKSISKKDGKFVLETSSDVSDPPHIHQVPIRKEFDTVILANPLQFSGIEIEEGLVERLPDEIPYVTLHATLFASPLKLSGEHFGLANGQAMPDTVLTTLAPGESASDRENIVGNVGFFSISTLRTALNPATNQTEYIYKIFSPEPVTSEFMSKIFNISLPEDLSTVPLTNSSQISWWYPHKWYSYPYEFPRVTFDDAELAKNLYYTSGIEPFISTMETSALMGKNVAQLVADDYLEILREEDEGKLGNQSTLRPELKT